MRDADPLTTQTGLTAPERRLRGRLAAHARWATDDGTKCGRAGQAALTARFEREVDPDNRLDPAERARRVECKRREHFTRLSLASAKARRLRRTAS